MKRKRILVTVLTGLIAVGLTACGGGLSSQEMQSMEKYAKAAGQSFEYSSLNHITDVKVAVPSGEETLAEIIEEKTGKLENIDLSEIEAIVTEKNRDGGELYLVGTEGETKKHFDSSAAAAVQSGSSSDQKASSSDSVATSSSASDDASEAEIAAAEAAGLTSTSGDEKATAQLSKDIASLIGKSYSAVSTPDGLRTLLAELLLKAEAYQTQHPSEYAAYQGYKKELKKSETLEENKDYYLKIAANSYQQQFDLYDFYVDYLEKMIKAAEVSDSTKRAEKMKQQDEISADDLEVRELLLAQAVCRNNAVGKAAAAQSILDANKSAVDAIKKDAGDEYKDDNRYLKLMMRNGELKAYEDQLFQVQQYTYAIEDLRERQKLNDSGLSEIYESIHDAEASYRENYYKERCVYASNLVAKEDYQNQHAAEFSDYQKVADAVKEKYSDDSYKKDMEYVKNEVKYESINSGLEGYEKLLKESQTKIDKLKSDLDDLTAEKKKDIESREEEMEAEADWEKVRAAAEEIITEMNKGYENPPSEKTEHHYIGEYGGFNWIDLSDTAVESVDSSRETETVRSSSSYKSKKSYSSKGGMKYDPNDKYYSQNDHDGDGRLSDDEFHDAVGDYLDDLMG